MPRFFPYSDELIDYFQVVGPGSLFDEEEEDATINRYLVLHTGGVRLVHIFEKMDVLVPKEFHRRVAEWIKYVNDLNTRLK